MHSGHAAHREQDAHQNLVDRQEARALEIRVAVGEDREGADGNQQRQAGQPELLFHEPARKHELV